MIFRSLFFLFVFSFLYSSSQSCLLYENLYDLEFSKKYKDRTEVPCYISKSGFEIRVGDTLTIGSAANDKREYQKGDVFSNIFIGKTKGTDRSSFKPLPFDDSGTKVVVYSIYARHHKYEGYQFWKIQSKYFGEKETPLYVNVFVKNLENNTKSISNTILSHAFSFPRKTIIDIEEALQNGEIINPSPVLNRSEAIQKLKESKDLMELDLLSEEEYNKLRDKLLPIIKDER